MMTQLLNLEVVDRLGLTLLHFLWQGTLAALFVWGGRSTLKTARARHALALIGMVAMLVIPIITFLTIAPAPTAERSVEANVVVLAEQISPMIEVAESTDTVNWNWRGAAAVLWMLGVIALAWRVPWGWMQLRRLQRDGLRVEDATILAAFERAKAAIGVDCFVALLTHAAAKTPMTFGWLKPVVLLPPATLAGLSTAQLEAILAHELAHIRRCDYLISLFQALVESLLFFHPAVWWVSRELSRERELAADDLVVQSLGNRMDYAKALANVAADHESLLAPAATDGALLRRVRRILVNEPRPANAIGRTWVALAASLAMLFAASRLVAHAQAGVASHDPADTVTVTGVVLDEFGQPIPGAKVNTAWGEEQNQPLRTVLTDGDGRFRFDRLPPAGPAPVVVRAKGHGSGYQRMELQAGKNLELEPFRLRTADQSITGRIIDEQGQPLREVELAVWGHRQPRRLAQPDSRGHFRVDQLINDWLWVQANFPCADGIKRAKRMRVRAGSSDLTIVKPDESTFMQPAESGDWTGRLAPPMHATEWRSGAAANDSHNDKIRVIQFVGFEQDLRFFHKAFPRVDELRASYPQLDALIAHTPWPIAEINERMAALQPKFKGRLVIEDEGRSLSAKVGLKQPTAVVIDQSGHVVFQGHWNDASKKAVQLLAEGNQT